MQTNAPPEKVLTIADLQDIVEPVAVEAWPFASGLWILLILLGAGGVILLGCRIRRYRAAAYRRAGLALLQTTPRSDGAALSVLLKRVALAAFPREQVAPLYGEEWLQFLDRTCPGCSFDSDAGHALAAQIWGGGNPAELTAADADNLFAQAARWIKDHEASPVGEVTPC